MQKELAMMLANWVYEKVDKEFWFFYSDFFF